MRQVGQAAAKMPRMAAEFRGQFMDAIREAGIDDIKADVTKLAEARRPMPGSVLAQIKAELTQALDAAGKPATLPVAGVPAIAAPHNAESSLNSIALPRLPAAPEEGAESLLAAGIAPPPRSWKNHWPGRSTPRCGRLPMRSPPRWGDRAHARRSGSAKTARQR
jgi:sec-independent protein translocase protein TatB